MKYLGILTILLLFSCSKKYKTKNYLVGEWQLDKISFINSTGFEYRYIPDGTIVFSKIDELNYEFELNASFPNDTIIPFSDSGLLTYDSKFKNYVFSQNGQKSYSSMPVLTKDELFFEFNSSNFTYKIVAGK